MKFEFTTPSRIIFGSGAMSQVPALAEKMGEKAFVLVGKNPDRAGLLLEQLRENKISTSIFRVTGEPTTHDVLGGVKAVQQTKSDFVISFGGGSVMDTGKAVAALMTNPGNLFDYLEVIGRGQRIRIPPAPHMAIPTTAGTGAEVTRNAVLCSPEQHVKISMRSRLMVPAIAIVDPGLTLSMPPRLTAYTGLDAVTQLIEAFVSNSANPITDALCREGLSRAARSLPQVFHEGRNREGREDMALASLLGGIALANAKLGVVHGFAAPLGGMFSVSHGAVCGCILPHVMEASIHAMAKRAPDSIGLLRYKEVARILTQKKTATPLDGVKFLKDLCGAFKIPKLTEFGVKPTSFSELIIKTQAASSTKGNPIELEKEELFSILKSASV